MRSLQGKRVVITGSASGIGRALAIELARNGCQLCLVDINRSGLAKTAEATRGWGAATLELVCDIGDSADVNKMTGALLRRWPEIDILINNAGITYRGNSEKMQPCDWERVLAVNLNGPIQTCQSLLPVLLKRPAAHVVNICSVLGLRSFSKFAAYSASKHGLVGYSKSLRAEYLRSQVGVTTVCPAFVQTPLIESIPSSDGRQLRRPPPRWLCSSPETVARKTVRAIQRNRGLVVVSPLAQLIWRLDRFVPSLFEVPGWLPKRRILTTPSRPSSVSPTTNRRVA